MRAVFCVLMLLPLSALAEIISVDFVRVLNGNQDEALYYYENNWKRYRIDAEEKGFISWYRLLARTSDDGQVDFLLMTAYPTEEHYADREANFATIMDASNGPKLLNEKTPGEFREVIDGAEYAVE